MNKLTYRQRAILCVIGGFMLTTGGGFSASLSLFLIPVTTEYGFSQASFSTYLALMSWFGIVSHPLLGRLFARYAKHIRLITLIAAFYGFLCFFLLSKSSALGQFYTVGSMISMLLPIAGPSLGMAVVSWWFTSGRSIAISCVAIGASVGTVFYAKVTEQVIQSYGWRAGYLSCAVMIFIVTAIGALLIAPPPEYTAQAAEISSEKSHSESDAPSTADSSVTLGELIKNPTFRLICLVPFFGMIYVMLIQQSIVPMLQIDFHQEPSTAATLLSVYSIVCACFKPVMGFIYKRFGKPAAILYIGVLITFASLLIFFSKYIGAAVLAIVLIGAGNMLAMVLLPSIVSDLFGARNYPVVNGYVSIFFTIGAGIGPIAGGKIFDLTGSYRIAFLTIAILCLITTFILLYTVRNKQTKSDKNIIRFNEEASR